MFLFSAHRWVPSNLPPSRCASTGVHQRESTATLKIAVTFSDTCAVNFHRGSRKETWAAKHTNAAEGETKPAATVRELVKSFVRKQTPTVHNIRTYLTVTLVDKSWRSPG